MTGTVLKSIANVMLGRADEALKDLSAPQIGNNNDAPIWRAMAYARQGRLAEAREGFRSSEVAIGALPIELQRVAKREALRCSIEVRDFAGAVHHPARLRDRWACRASWRRRWRC